MLSRARKFQLSSAMYQRRFQSMLRVRSGLPSAFQRKTSKDEWTAGKGLEFSYRLLCLQHRFQRRYLPALSKIRTCRGLTSSRLSVGKMPNHALFGTTCLC